MSQTGLDVAASTLWDSVILRLANKYNSTFVESTNTL
jgi:hypothetical protein